MTVRTIPWLAMMILLLATSLTAAQPGSQEPTDDTQAGDTFQESFRTHVRPFLEQYCLDCHGASVQEAKLDLSGYESLDAVVGDLGHWELVLERLAAGEMPPEDAEPRPSQAARERVVDWITRLRRREANRRAGDPGPVLARRLSNSEYDYTIQDLTGQNLQPTREFPVDPANEAGFDNSGESLAMSPALLKKYLDAARQVADHLVLTPTGIEFAPHPVVTDSDRDKYCVHRIVEFYRRQPVDLADYFFAAWRLARQSPGQQGPSLAEVAREEGLSEKYLATVWDLLTDTQLAAGPIAELRGRWSELPREDTVAAGVGCEALGEWVVRRRQELVLPPDVSATRGLQRSLQPTIVWINQQIAANRQRGQLPEPDGTPATEARIAAIQRFCAVFPDEFYVSERGRMFLDPKERNKGRLLSAGFHLMVGYFRDDQPLYDLVLDPRQQQELDRMWRELDFVTRAPMRQFRDFIYFERAESTQYLTAPEFDFARSEDDDITSPEKMARVARLFVAKAKERGTSPEGLRVLEAYFAGIAEHVRSVERDSAEAPEKQLEAVLEFAERAWRGPLDDEQRQELLGVYQELRDQEQLAHEDAMRDLVATILVSPRFSYRVDASPPGTATGPLDHYALANRLSYFLWSSMPDAELLQHAARGELDRPEILTQQVRRMLADPRSRRLAVEFGGQWLEFRPFQQHNAVDRNRFPEFTAELRQAMFDEPVYFLHDLIRGNGSVLELLDARHTFVNSVLARHYGIPVTVEGPDDWVRVEHADAYGRGGLLPMAVFLTKNAPGLRTSPVKRGYWVVRRLLGEHIPAPPADVPELPRDEAELGQRSLREVLAAHREVKSCAACHRRFDAIGLAFEGYGPVGERREVDLGNRPVDDRAEFPDGSEGQGLEGLRDYLRRERADDLVDHLCRKLLAYALGRSLLLSDEPSLEQIRGELQRHDHRFQVLIENIVLSPQFLNRRGREFEP